jgi:hypothetical protein
MIASWLCVIIGADELGRKELLAVAAKIPGATARAPSRGAKRCSISSAAAS